VDRCPNAPQSHGASNACIDLDLFAYISTRTRSIYPREHVLVSVVVLFGTLGFHAGKFLDAVPRAGVPVERIVIYTGRAAGQAERRMSTAALAEVEQTLRSMTIPCTHREFSSPWNFVEILRAMMSDLRQERAENVVFNLTGGPKTMTVAATIACLVAGAKAVYVPEELKGGAAPIELPLLRIRYSEILTKGQQRVLRAIRDRQPESLNELAVLLRLKNPTISFHVERLRQIGAVTFLPNPRNRLLRTPRVTPAGEIMLLAEEILGVESADKKRGS